MPTLVFLIIIMVWGSARGTDTNSLNSYTSDFIEGVYSKDILVTVQSRNESIIYFPNSTSIYPYTVYVWSEDKDFEYPVLVMVRQQRLATSWEVPLAVESRTGTFQFQNTSRTLCHNHMDPTKSKARILDFTEEFDLEKSLTVSVSTASSYAIPVTVRVEEYHGFYLEENVDYDLQVSPSEPRFFYYKFLERNHSMYTSTIILEVFSEDDICLTVSIQNASCPVFDLNKDISYKGHYQTISTKGGIIIKKKQFPSGFFVVFVAKGDNYDCSHERGLIPAAENVQRVETLTRSTKIKFNLKPTIFKSAYVQASVSVVAGTAAFYLFTLALSWAVFHYKRKRQAEDVALNGAEPNREDLEEGEPLSANGDAKAKETVRSYEELQNKGKLMLSDLAKKHPQRLRRKSWDYLSHIISIAIFYAIPVVQLVITYQRILNDTGNQDVCYYNFLCAHPMWGFSDLNHIVSNIGYVLAGVAFFAITFYKDRHLKDTFHNYGIPKHFGLYYAMGISLVMEGILSASYHVCPNQSNFQFDTSFMYIMVTLSIIKLYQNRHPDVNATAYATFMIIGFAIFAAMVGIVAGNIVLWIMFVILYNYLCVYVSIKVYFMKESVKGIKKVLQTRTEDGILKAVTPIKKDRFAYLVAGNIINFTLSVLLSCIFRHDFATYLLALLIVNAVLYTSAYIVMKKKNGERICTQAKVFIVLSLITWGIALWCFKMNLTDWKVSPAMSRQLNGECMLLDFYDYHDIWHFLSAYALFFTFMLLLCLDDDIINTPHTQITVF